MSVAISWQNKWNRPSVTFRSVCQYPVTLVLWHKSHMLVLQFNVAAIVGIVSRCGLTIEVCHRSHPNNNKPALYNQLFSCYF